MPCLISLISLGKTEILQKLLGKSLEIPFASHGFPIK